VRNGLV